MSFIRFFFHWSQCFCKIKSNILIINNNKIWHRDDSRFASNQWEMSLQSDAISHWLWHTAWQWCMQDIAQTMNSQKEPHTSPHRWAMGSWIAKILGLMAIRHQSQTEVSDRYLIDITPRIFAIWIVYWEALTQINSNTLDRNWYGMHTPWSTSAQYARDQADTGPELAVASSQCRCCFVFY